MPDIRIGPRGAGGSLSTRHRPDPLNALVDAVLAGADGAEGDLVAAITEMPEATRARLHRRSAVLASATRPRTATRTPRRNRDLTADELTLLYAAAEGLTVPEIAAQRYASTHTVKDQLRTIRDVLGAVSTTHAVHLAHVAHLFDHLGGA